jgi:hypothetical protein
VLPESQGTLSWPFPTGQPGVVAGDGSLVAGLEPGVRVCGVFQGDAVAALVAGLAAHRLLPSGAWAACAARSRAMLAASAQKASPAAVK